ncbi:hypothetical protein [Mesorhizobium sp.]|uniref:hypothetical protein n=1 Tax=Mesorhizobium sp. TaxID=1871066 RepID=UPI0025EFA646|nr:hypothetical protein [Mesorhizobium sp.]
MRIIGMDIYRVAAEVVSLLDGEIVKLGRVQMLRDKLEEFASVNAGSILPRSAVESSPV